MLAASLCVVALLALAGCASSGDPFPISPSSTKSNADEPWRTRTPAQALRFRPVDIALPVSETAHQLIERGLPAAVAYQLANLTCAPGFTNPRAGQDDANAPLATCDQAGQTKYLLGPAISDGPTTLDGTAISSAVATPALTGSEYVVDITFTPAAGATWASYTAAHLGQQIAIVLNSTVVSAPTIEQPITTGQAQISGEFTQQEAQDLAAWLDGH